MKYILILALIVGCICSNSFAAFVGNGAVLGNDQQSREARSGLTKKDVRQMIDESLQELRGSGELCYMGMKSFLIYNSRITASSHWGPEHEHYRARLDNYYVDGVSKGAWSAASNTVGQWLQVDFGSVQKIAGVITQGRPPPRHIQYVRSYKVSCGEYEDSLTFVKESGQDKVFAGNIDINTKVYRRFPQVFSCRFIRIYPQTWHTHISMRVEFVHGACFNNPFLP